MSRTLKFIDMFAGIGGFRTGLEAAGHTCVGYIEKDKFARKSYQAIYDTTNEYTAEDIQKVSGGELPRADIWTFGSPCQDISIAGKGAGIVKGSRSSMFFEVIRLLKERVKLKKTLPTYLIMENVKNLLSSNRGWDFARVISEMDKAGYDVEWSVLDSAQVVPQHRERIYIIGHLRESSTRKVFPIQKQSRATAKKSKVKVLGHYGAKKHQSSVVYNPTGASPTLTATDYKRPAKVAVKQVKEPRILVKNATVQGYTVAKQGDGVDLAYPCSNTRRGRVQHERVNTLSTSSNLGVVVKAALTPDRIKKRQNGRRFKENREPEFTVTAQDRHGVLIDDGSSLTIRKLTPLECWRLQGFSDEQFYKARDAGVSDSQLYKQAGNAVTTKVVEAIGKKLAYE